MFNEFRVRRIRVRDRVSPLVSPLPGTYMIHSWDRGINELSRVVSAPHNKFPVVG